MPSAGTDDQCAPGEGTTVERHADGDCRDARRTGRRARRQSSSSANSCLSPCPVRRGATRASPDGESRTCRQTAVLLSVSVPWFPAQRSNHPDALNAYGPSRSQSPGPIATTAALTASPKPGCATSVRIVRLRGKVDVRSLVLAPAVAASSVRRRCARRVATDSIECSGGEVTAVPSRDCGQGPFLPAPREGSSTSIHQHHDPRQRHEEDRSERAGDADRSDDRWGVSPEHGEHRRGTERERENPRRHR